MAVQFIRKVRDRQPQGHVGIDRNNKLGAKVFDAWNAPTLMQQSAMLRKPTVKPSSIGFKPGRFGLGAYATTGSVRYDIGEYGETSPHAFAVILSVFDVSAGVSIVRKDGAFVPAQIALSTLRGVPWDPVDGGVYYYPSISGHTHATVIFNRISTSTVNLIENGKQAASKTGLTGYGSTSNPLCFLGTESNIELCTATYGLFFAAVAFTNPLTESEILEFTANPWQIFEPETIPLFFSTVTVQFLRPISDVSNSGWTPSTGTDLFSCIGETVRNDATYISATAPGAICEVLLGTSSGDPLSSINHLPRIVMSAGTGGIILRLKQGVTLIKEWTYASLAATDTLYEPTLTSGEIDAITDYTNLRLEMETTA